VRFVTFTAGGRTRAGLAVDGHIVDLAAAGTASGTKAGQSAVPDSVIGVLEVGEPALEAARRVETWARGELQAGRRPTAPDGQPIIFDAREVRLGPPIPRPGKIICLGLNYADHAREGGSEVPKVPMFFAKFANTLIGSGESIVLPRESQRMDYEAEFAFVIGKKGKHVPLDRAMDYVAGYMNLNDVSARDLQSETSQFFRGKGGDTWAPCGPYLVTRDEVADPGNLGIRCTLNGQVMQNSNTNQLIFGVPFLVHHLTKTVTLEPGDVISTGTPSGVGNARKPPVYLKPGDVVKIEVEGLGTLENTCVAE
jgi:acylpyruvate hydrolase